MTITTQSHDMQATHTATAHVLAWFAALGGQIRQRAANAAERRQVRAMLDLNDHLLRDIGLERDDVVAALSGPLSESPSEHLQHVKAQRSRIRMERLPGRQG